MYINLKCRLFVFFLIQFKVFYLIFFVGKTVVIKTAVSSILILIEFYIFFLFIKQYLEDLLMCLTQFIEGLIFLFFL